MPTDSTVDVGVFGSKVLQTYCGESITNQFYATGTDGSAVLLTEEQMAKVALQNVVEFMLFAFLSVSLQTLFSLYISSMQQCCDSCRVEDNETQCRTFYNVDNETQCPIHVACPLILALRISPKVCRICAPCLAELTCIIPSTRTL